MKLLIITINLITGTLGGVQNRCRLYQLIFNAPLAVYNKFFLSAES